MPIRQRATSISDKIPVRPYGDKANTTLDNDLEFKLSNIPEENEDIPDPPEVKPSEVKPSAVKPSEVKLSVSRKVTKPKRRRRRLLNLQTNPIAQGELQLDNELELDRIAIKPYATDPLDVNPLITPLHAFALQRVVNTNEVEMDDDDDIHKPIGLIDPVEPVIPEHTIPAHLQEQVIDTQLQKYMNRYPIIKPLVMSKNDSRVTDENKKISLFGVLQILSNNNNGFTTTQLDYVCRQISGMSIRRLCLDRLPYILSRYSDIIRPEVRVWFDINMANFEQIVTECDTKTFRTVRPTSGSKDIAAGIKENTMLTFIITHMLCFVAAQKPGILEQGKDFVRSIIQRKP